MQWSFSPLMMEVNVYLREHCIQATVYRRLYSAYRTLCTGSSTNNPLPCPLHVQPLVQWSCASFRAAVPSLSLGPQSPPCLLRLVLSSGAWPADSISWNLDEARGGIWKTGSSKLEKARVLLSFHLTSSSISSLCYVSFQALNPSPPPLCLCSQSLSFCPSPPLSLFSLIPLPHVSWPSRTTNKVLPCNKGTIHLFSKYTLIFARYRENHSATQYSVPLWGWCWPVPDPLRYIKSHRLIIGNA